MVQLGPTDRQHLRLALTEFINNFLLERCSVLPHYSKLTAELATQCAIDSLTRCDQCGLITCEHSACRSCAACFECDTVEARERISSKLRRITDGIGGEVGKSIFSIVDDSYRRVRREEN